MCDVKPTTNGARKVTPSGIVYYDNTPEGHAAQAADMNGGSGGEAGHPGDPQENPNPPDTTDCTTFTDSLWDTACSKYYKFANMKMKPVAQNGLTNGQIACNWQKLCQNILDPLSAGGQKVSINSGFRSAAFNASLGSSSKTSDHMTGCASDISAGSVEANKELFKYIGRSGLPFSQLIFEGRWVHVAYGGASPSSVAVLVARGGSGPYQNGGGRSGSALPPDLRWA
jgi:zinc D-Ala-D-Ala carboxypeptidase